MARLRRFSEMRGIVCGSRFGGIVQIINGRGPRLPPAPAERHNLAMKRTLLIAGSLTGLVLAIVVAIPLFIDANRFRPLLESELTSALGREVKLGDLKLSILSGSVTAGDLSIADNPAYSRQPFVQAKSL